MADAQRQTRARAGAAATATAGKKPDKASPKADAAPGAADTEASAKAKAAPKRGRGRPATPPEELRARLIDAAERCFDRDPYEKVGIMDIVREARMSSRSFYRFFENKVDVAVALASDRAEAFVGDMQTIVRESDNSLEVVDRMLMTYLRDLPMVVADLQRVPPSAGARIQEVVDQYRQKIAEVVITEITRGLQEGLVTSLPDPMSVSLVISGIESMSIRLNTERRREDLIAMHPAFLAAVRNLFADWISEDQKIH